MDALVRFHECLSDRAGVDLLALGFVRRPHREVGAINSDVAAIGAKGQVACFRREGANAGHGIENLTAGSAMNWCFSLHCSNPCFKNGDVVVGESFESFQTGGDERQAQRLKVG